MTYEQLVEKVAAAIRVEMFGRSFLEIPVSTTEPAARLAIAVVAAAIREPTLKMVRAGAQAQVADIPGESVELTCFRMSAAEWKAMLAASPVTPTPQEKP